jgi:hypothetical protein
MTKGFSPDFDCLGNILTIFYYILAVSSNLFAIKVKFLLGSWQLMLNLLWDDCYCSTFLGSA